MLINYVCHCLDQAKYSLIWFCVLRSIAHSGSIHAYEHGSVVFLSGHRVFKHLLAPGV